MSRIKNRDGFTLIEILVATLIMAIGFLSLAEMEALSLRQKQYAENGTTATNIIQFVSDRDMAEVKRRYLLNSTAYATAQSGGSPDFTYCSGSTNSACSACPCDPLQAITPTTTNGTTETTCAAIDIQNFDPKNLNFTTSKTQCQTNLTNTINAKRPALFLIKQATTNVDTTVVPNIVTVSITYAVKTQTQFNKTGLTSLSIKDTLATQSYQVTAHIDTTYSTYIPGWSQIRVPHIP
ncbi:MAG: hypothetical protein C4291_04395 [Candidatus Dadabacteria bacterium]